MAVVVGVTSERAGLIGHSETRREEFQDRGRRDRTGKLNHPVAGSFRNGHLTTDNHGQSYCRVYVGTADRTESVGGQDQDESESDGHGENTTGLEADNRRSNCEQHEEEGSEELSDELPRIHELSFRRHQP